MSCADENSFGAWRSYSQEEGVETLANRGCSPQAQVDPALWAGSNLRIESKLHCKQLGSSVLMCANDVSRLCV